MSCPPYSVLHRRTPWVAAFSAGLVLAVLAGCESPPPPPEPAAPAVAPAAPAAPSAQFLRDMSAPPEWMLVRIGMVDDNGERRCVYASDAEFSIHRGGGLVFGAFGTSGAVSISGSAAFSAERTDFSAELDDFHLAGPDALAQFRIRADAQPDEQYEIELYCVVGGQRMRASALDDDGTRGGPIIIIENGDRGGG